MPRNSVKKRREVFDPNAFEFTGEEAIQADKAAKSRPTYRRQKLSILSALPDVPNPFTTLADRPVLTFTSAEDTAKRDVHNQHEFKSTPRRAQHSIGVSRRETKRTKRGRERTVLRTKPKLVKRKPSLEAIVSLSIKREVTPDPPVPSTQSATQDSSEASGALRRSGRKRYRTAKALQVYEESRKKPRTQKRRRGRSDIDPKTNTQGTGIGPECVLECGESLQEEKNPSKTEVTQPVHEGNSELHAKALGERKSSSDIEQVDQPKEKESSEMFSQRKRDSLLEDKSDKSNSEIDSETHAAIENMSDRMIHQNESRPFSLPAGRPRSPAEGNNVDESQTQDLEPRCLTTKPSMAQLDEEQPSGYRQPNTADRKSNMQQSSISDKTRKEDSSNSTGFHVQKEESQDSRKQRGDIAPNMEVEPSPLRTVTNPMEKDQDSSLFVSPVTPTQPKNGGLGCISDPKVAESKMRDAAEGQNLPHGLKIKESTTSSEAPTSVTTSVQCMKPETPVSFASGLDGQHGCVSTTEQKSEAQSRSPQTNEGCGQIQEPSSSQMGKASLRRGDMASAVVPRCEDTTRFATPKPAKAMTDGSANHAREMVLQDDEVSEVHEYEREPNHNFTAEEELKNTRSEHSMKPPEQATPMQSVAEITAPSEDKVQSLRRNMERTGSPEMKTDLSTNLTKCQTEGSIEEMQHESLSLGRPAKHTQRGSVDAQFPQKDIARSSSEATHIDSDKRCKSFATASLGKREIEEECNVPIITTNHGECKTTQNAKLSLQESRKGKQTFSKRVRFVEPEKSSLPSVGRKGCSDIMKMRMRKARRRQMTPLVPNGPNVTVMTMRGSGPNEKERRVYLDELQYLLDGVFKPSGKAEEKSPQLESQLISKTLISLTQLLMRKSREVSSSEEDESDSALIQILSTQPALFRSMVSQLCGVFGKSRSIDAMLAVVFVLIFRATPKLCLINAVELDILLNAFFRSSAAALKENEEESTKKSLTAKEGKGVDTKKRRGRLAKRFEESEAESSVLSALNKVVMEASIAEEFSGFKNEAVAGSHLIAMALSLVMCFHGNLRSLMRENRRLDKVVAVLYSCEKLLVQKTGSNAEEKKLHFVHNEASTSWVVLGASLKVLEFAILDKVCQVKTARESRLCAIVVDVIRSVKCLREGMFGSEWILSAALRVAINLCHGFGEASRQFVKQKGHELALMWVTKECYVAGLLSGEHEHHCTDGIHESFDVRVLCLALLATVVDQERDICGQFHTLNVTGFKERISGGLQIAIEVLQAAETSLETADEEAQAKDDEEAGRRRPPDTSERKHLTERAEQVLERRITIGYASLLVGALVHENVKNREMAEKLIPSNNLIGIAAVLTGFLEFHHEVGIISGSMDRMYARIIDSLVKPFHREDTVVVESGESFDVGHNRGKQEDASLPPEAECT